MDNALTNYEFRAIFKRMARLPVYPGPQKCVNCTNLTADRFGDHTLRCENKTERHNFVCARLKMVLENCGCKVLVEQGATYHNLRRSGDLMVQNWKPGVDLYIDVSVIDPNGESWRNDLLVGGSGEAARKKEAEKRDYYRKHFKLIDKRHEFMPFIIEAQGGVGSIVLKIISASLKRKKELCLRNISRTVKRREICGGEMLKKIIFESQRQMARTLLDKTVRENHIISKKLESKMLVEQASRDAIKTLKKEELKIRASTIPHPAPKPVRSLKTTPGGQIKTEKSLTQPQSELEVTKLISATGKPVNSKAVTFSPTKNRQPSSNYP